MKTNKIKKRALSKAASVAKKTSSFFANVPCTWAVNNIGYGNEMNCGALMTKYLAQFYKNNSYANY